MAQLREFAQHSKDFEAAKTRVVAISADTQDLSHQTWEKAAQKQFSILSDPGTTAIKAYGLLTSQDGKPVSKRTLILVDEQGMLLWQEPAGSMTAEEVLKKIQG